MPFFRIVSKVINRANAVQLAISNIPKCVRCIKAILKAVATVDQLNTAILAYTIAELFVSFLFIQYIKFVTINTSLPNKQGRKYCSITNTYIERFLCDYLPYKLNSEITTDLKFTSVKEPILLSEALY